jgi:hypothetical protein
MTEELHQSLRAIFCPYCDGRHFAVVREVELSLLVCHQTDPAEIERQPRFRLQVCADCGHTTWFSPDPAALLAQVEHLNVEVVEEDDWDDDEDEDEDEE